MQERQDSRRAWLIVLMLYLFMLINFADKAVIGLSAVPIMRDLKLTHTEFGAIGSSFFAFFSIGAVLVGFLVNRVSTKWVLLAMALVWSVAQLPMMLNVGVSLLVANRVVLGAGEGPAYPVALHAVYKWFPGERRPFPTSLVSLGGASGAGIAAPAVVWMIMTFSWHAAFAVLGLLGLVWAVAWLFIGAEGPEAVTQPAAARGAAAIARVPYRDLLTCRTTIGCFVLGFSAYWMLTLGFVWLASYLERGIGYSPRAASWIITMPALCQIITQPAICALSQRLRRSGVSSRLAHGAFAGTSVLIAGTLTAIFPSASGMVLPALCIAVAFSIGSVVFVLGHVIIAEVTPPLQRGAMLGINNAVATLAGVVAPVLMGSIVDTGANTVEGFRTGFLMTGIMVAVGGLIGLLLINPESDRRRFALRGEPDGLEPLVPAADL